MIGSWIYIKGVIVLRHVLYTYITYYNTFDSSLWIVNMGKIHFVALHFDNIVRWH